jgi:putative glycerol-1-phosphate prenyltransferase
LEILNYIQKKSRAKQPIIAQLIDPDHIESMDHVLDIAARAKSTAVDFFFFGGSLITQRHDFNVLAALKAASSIPVILFPSNAGHIREEADGILFLSLVSGRNPDFLIGNHVIAAPLLKGSQLEVLSTSYLLIDSGANTTANYMSNTLPIPFNKPEIAAATAYAGQLLGHKLIYLDGGSGADKPVSTDMVREVRAWTDLPIIVGGGIRSAETAKELIEAGADILVIGNKAQEQPAFLNELYEKVK